MNAATSWKPEAALTSSRPLPHGVPSYLCLPWTRAFQQDLGECPKTVSRPLVTSDGRLRNHDSNGKALSQGVPRPLHGQYDLASIERLREGLSVVPVHQDDPLRVALVDEPHELVVPGMG